MALKSSGNDFGVKVQPTVLPTTKTYHGVSIQTENGAIIGRIQTFNATFGERACAHIYELSRETVGRPVDYVPANESGRAITMSRVELWEEELEVALAAAGQEYVDLCDQTKPFSIIESFFRGSAQYRAWQYVGCWFASRSLDDFSAEGDMKVNAQATVNYVFRKAAR